MKAWLKTGLFGLLIGIILWGALWKLFGHFDLAIYTDFVSLLIGTYHCAGECSIIRIVTAPASFFVIGAVIGLIIQIVRRK